MNSKKVIGLVVAGLALVAIGIWWFTRSHKVSGPKGTCETDVETYVMNDRWMSGLIEKGTKYKVELNWYKCNPIQKGDVVLYRYSQMRDPVVRMVRAAPGDEFKLIQNKAKLNWNIEVNGDLLRVNDEPFFFGTDVPPVLSLYERANKGKLDANTVLLFSNTPPGDEDSSSFGAVAVSDIIGRVLMESVDKHETPSKPAEPDKTPPPDATKAEQTPPAKEPVAAKQKAAPKPVAKKTPNAATTKSKKPK